jgi:hypothetical protein
MSTVKKRHQDAGLQAELKKKPYLRLDNKKKRLRWAKEHRHWTEEPCPRRPISRSCLFTVDVRLVFYGYYLMKLPVEEL